MRTAYREELDDFAHDLIVMCDTVRAVMDKASDALLRGSLQSAEDALSHEDMLAEIRARSEERAVNLLALEQPAPDDLRQVISSIYIVNDFDRMGRLAMHIANTARKRHPETAIPEAVCAYFVELHRLVGEMSTTARGVLVEPDTDVALDMAEDDDAVDELYHHLVALVSREDWEYSSKEAVDVAMLAREYERYADHCVAVASRIVYLITGMKPEEYLDEAPAPTLDTPQRFEELRRLYWTGA
jgi:phosphate transport system protein